MTLLLGAAIVPDPLANSKATQSVPESPFG